jgi:hypothetical protein
MSLAGSLFSYNTIGWNRNKKYFMKQACDSRNTSSSQIKLKAAGKYSRRMITAFKFTDDQLFIH